MGHYTVSQPFYNSDNRCGRRKISFVADVLKVTVCMSDCVIVSDCRAFKIMTRQKKNMLRQNLKGCHKIQTRAFQKKKNNEADDSR